MGFTREGTTRARDARASQILGSAVLLGVVVACASCGQSDASASTGSGARRPAAAHHEVEVTGAVVQVGGPITADSGGKTPTYPRTAVVKAFKESPDRNGHGRSPEAKVHTEASGGGRFALKLVPGFYVLVARTATGMTGSEKVRIPAKKETVSVKIRLVVP